MDKNQPCSLVLPMLASVQVMRWMQWPELRFLWANPSIVKIAKKIDKLKPWRCKSMDFAFSQPNCIATLRVSRSNTAIPPFRWLSQNKTISIILEAICRRSLFPGFLWSSSDQSGVFNFERLRCCHVHCNDQAFDPKGPVYLNHSVHRPRSELSSIDRDAARTRSKDLREPMRKLPRRAGGRSFRQLPRSANR